MSDSVDTPMSKKLGTGNKPIPPPQNRSYFLILTLLWTFAMIILLLWNLREHRKVTLESAVIQAQQAFEKDLVYRRWNAQHGGVYVPPTSTTPPNPYLAHLNNRDITTNTGEKLTLVNPAYMTRQVLELGQKEFGLEGHITSLNPIRPENAADSWETDALLKFEEGETEFHSIDSINGEEYMRFMRPLYVEPSCLKCHAEQGYRVNDIRGGISVSVPMDPLWEAGNNHEKGVILGYILIWFIGLVGIGVGNRSSKKKQSERDRFIKDLQKSQHHNEYINAILLGIRNVNHLITKETDPDRLIQGACDNLTETFGYHTAWIALLDETGRATSTASAGIGELFQQMDEKLKNDGFGECGKSALAKSGIVIVHDPKSECKDCPLSESYGGFTGLKIRLAYEDNIFGMLTVTVPHEFTYDVEAKALFHQVATDIAFALNKIELEKAHKHAREKLNKSETLKQAILDGIATNIAFVNEKLEIIWANKASADSVGKTPDEMIGGKCHAFWANTEEPCDDCPTLKAFETQKSEHSIMKTPDGKVWDERAEPVLDQDGKLIGVVEIAHNITERNRTEEALLKSELKYRTLAENAPDMIFLIDTEFKVLSLNSVASHAFGKSPEEVIGRPISELFPEKMVKVYTRSLKKVIESGKSLIAESRMVANGVESWINTNLNRVEDMDGKVVGVLGVVRDISERKFAEDKIKAQLDELTRWYDLHLNREDRLGELKREINELLRKAGKEIRYPSQETKT